MMDPPEVLRVRGGQLRNLQIDTGRMAAEWVIIASLTTIVVIVVKPLGDLPRTLLARRRRARGLCIACGYNLSGNASGRCPECGAAIPSGCRVADAREDVGDAQ